jgi:hypothetical protein
MLYLFEENYDLFRDGKYYDDIYHFACCWLNSKLRSYMTIFDDNLLIDVDSETRLAYVYVSAESLKDREFYCPDSFYINAQYENLIDDSILEVRLEIYLRNINKRKMKRVSD